MDEASEPVCRGPGRAAALPPDERRRAIIEAVAPLLLEHGADVTTRQIAEAAGVAEGTLFRVFPDKVTLLHATAHSMLDPDRNRRAFRDIDPALPLDQMVAVVTEQLVHSTRQAMAVLMALRGLRAGPDRSDRPGPPSFVIESYRALMQGLTELFERYRDELRVEPERAALLLRALVFGSRQPWTDPSESPTSDEIASVLLTGVARTRT